MSDVFNISSTEELRKIKVCEPDLSYAGRSTPREVIFALDIPYPLLKKWYGNVKQFSLQPEVNNLTGSEEEFSVELAQFPYISLLEHYIPDRHFVFTDDKDVRKDINENLRKIAATVTKKYN